MSVICQNFVQNAWKKDLCSNCFKSYGDHSDVRDHVKDTDSSVNGKTEHEESSSNPRYTPQATTIYQSRNGMPSSHITWKSLISEKNTKNAQPFKLESGFKGKLLTINNVFEKNSKEACTNVKSDQQLPDESHAGESKTRNGVSVFKNSNEKETPLNVRSCVNKTTPEEEIPTCNGKVLQGILKKSSVVPSPKAHARRSSNVGFKEEEPLVIGYGGRDFSPEELEWEMGADGEGGSASDSLDETEEDKVISKLTKQNTEFNSNNNNLLQENGSSKSEVKTTDLVENGRSVEPTQSFNELVSQNKDKIEVPTKNSKVVTSRSPKSKVNSKNVCEPKNNGALCDKGSKNSNNVKKSENVSKVAMNNIRNEEKNNSLLPNGTYEKQFTNETETDEKKEPVLCNVENSGKCTDVDKVDRKKFPVNGLSKTVLCSKQFSHSFSNTTSVLRNHENNSDVDENVKNDNAKEENNVLNERKKPINSLREKTKVTGRATSGKKEANTKVIGTDKIANNDDNAGSSSQKQTACNHGQDAVEETVTKENTQSDKIDTQIEYDSKSKHDQSGSHTNDSFCGKETTSDVITKEELSEASPPAVGASAKNENIAPKEEGASVEDHVLGSGGRNSSAVFASERAQWEEVRQRESSYNHPFVPESPGIDGVINQAINTSLTRGITDDGHLINNSCEPQMTSLDNEGSSDTPISAHASDISQCKDEKIQPEVTSYIGSASSMGEETADSLVANQDVDDSVPSEMLVNETSDCVKPRASFLHGISSEPNLLPNAVYSPAGDLFVKRRSSSSSSSSSSSDENRKSQTSVSCNDLTKPFPTENAETSANVSRTSFQEQNTSASESEKPSFETASESRNTLKTKPLIPTKPTKPLPGISKSSDERQYAVPLLKSENTDAESVYYSVANGASNNKVPPISHYAESNIYQEVAATTARSESVKGEFDVARESKLAALAMELEQVRCTNGSTKRQAPAPPRIPDPPLEEPPNRTHTESPHPPHVFRSDSVPFSSSSSTTSSSSQDTDTGFSASWNFHSDFSTSNPSSKSKGSFLLNQYSKCKMLALGYSEDGGKTRKKFSLKKLLKIGKESDVPVTFDPNYPNPKAWKYSENFERPRAKLEIIHPMDLEKSTVTINPGFEPVRLSSTGSIGSLTSSFDSYSVRTSMSSDYGNFDPDSLRSHSSLDSKSTSSYDGGLSSDSGTCISNISTNGQGISRQGSQTPNSSKSPTPSRSSLSSQASTITSTCSKYGIPARPPKPPPPPRAHSLLPGNKNFRSSNGTFKCPDSSPCSIKGRDETENLPPKPQVPKRQFRPSMKSEYANVEAKNSFTVSDDSYSCQETENSLEKNSCEGNTYECIRTQSVGSEENDDCQYQDVALPEDKSSALEISENSQVIPSEMNATSDLEETVVQSFGTSETKWETTEKSKSSEITESNYSVSSKRSSSQSDMKGGDYHSTLSRNKHSPLTKAPSRPPPIYVKPQRMVNSKCKPWKVLENSYAMLSSNNREILIKLVECGMMKRPSLLEMRMMNLRWEDFKLDTGRPAVVYAFGDKIVYDATLSNDLDFQITLVISIQSQSPGYDSSTQLKYPVLGHFNTSLPSNLLQADIQENHLETVSASVCVLYRAEVITIENFIEDLPESNLEELDRELCFILLQLIKGLKVLQAQGIESIDASFQNLILCKTEYDNLHTLVFLSDDMFDDTNSIYTSVSENSKISLCQYALMLLFQLIKTESSEELLSSDKFGSTRKSSKIFISSISLLKEEKAVSLSQVKTLLECYIWGVQTVLLETDPSDYDSVLQRWMDIERSNFVKSLISKSQLLYLSTEEEFYSDFLVRTNIRSIKDITEFM